MKKVYKYIMILTAMLFMFSGCAPQNRSSISPPDTPKESVKDMETNTSPEIIYQKLDQKTAIENLSKDKTILLVDVRTPEEHAEKRIPDSILIPDYEIEKSASKLLPDKEAVIYLYCRSGRRSKAAANQLIDMGYAQVFDIGGIIDWKYETESGN